MKTCRLLVAIALSALAVSCSDKASVSGTLEGAGGKQLILKRLDVSHYKVLDTLTTSSSGAWSYSLKVEQGHPQFLYAFYGEQKVASLLVSPGERIKLVSDTLGHYSVRGSGESERLRQVEADFAAFLAEMTGIVETSDDVERDLSRSYIAYRRSRLSYVMENSHSLTIVPVLFQQVNETLPIFNEPTDAILFRNLADSLRSVYPESAYVKALDKEAERRSTLLELDLRLRSAGEVGFIDMELPSMDGSKKKLSETQGKVVMLYFWAATDAQKMFNLDALTPLYEEFHPRGFEICGQDRLGGCGPPSGSSLDQCLRHAWGGFPAACHLSGAFAPDGLVHRGRGIGYRSQRLGRRFHTEVFVLKTLEQFFPADGGHEIFQVKGFEVRKVFEPFVVEGCFGKGGHGCGPGTTGDEDPSGKHLPAFLGAVTDYQHRTFGEDVRIGVGRDDDGSRLGQLLSFRGEDGAVDFQAAGVNHRDDIAEVPGMLPLEGGLGDENVQGADADERDPCAEAESFGGRNADAETRVGPRPLADGYGVKILHLEPLVFEEAVHEYGGQGGVHARLVAFNLSGHETVFGDGCRQQGSGGFNQENTGHGQDCFRSSCFR